MRNLHIDFVQRQEDLAWIGYALLISVLLLALLEGRLYGRATAELATWQQVSLRTGQARLRSVNDVGSAASPIHKQGQARELEGAAAVIALISRPWDELFAQIEAVASENVSLLGIEPDNELGNIRLTVESRNMESMLAYVSALTTLPMLEMVSLLNHQVQRQQEQAPVRFVVAAKWSALARSVPAKHAKSRAGG